MSKTVEVVLPLDSSRTEADIAFEVLQLQDRLKQLYLERRGMQVTGSEESWCCSCGKMRVHPSQGEEVCDRCTAAMA